MGDEQHPRLYYQSSVGYAYMIRKIKKKKYIF